MLRTLTIAALALTLAGCASIITRNIEAKQEACHREHPEWADVCDKLGAGGVWLGMTDDQMIFAKGLPHERHGTHATSYGSEQWVYWTDHSVGRADYYYFRGGVLVSAQIGSY